MSTVKQISALAKKIYAKKPSMKWTDAIKQASRELKASGKISTSTKKTTKRKPASKRITGAYKRVYKVVKKDTKGYELKYIDENGKNWYTGSFTTKAAAQKAADILNNKKPDTFTKVGATKKPVKRSTPKKKVSGKHTDNKSHNVRINVLSGVRPVPVIFNGVGRLVKNKYYIYNGKDIYPIVGLKGATTWKGSLLKYLGKKDNTLLFEIRFKLKTKAGFDNITERWELPNTLPANTFIPTKKPTLKELAIGHLKLPNL